MNEKQIIDMALESLAAKTGLHGKWKRNGTVQNKIRVLQKLLSSLNG